MNNLTIEIKAPELTQAILALANVLSGTAPNVQITQTTPEQVAQPIPPQVPVPTAPIAPPAQPAQIIPTVEQPAPATPTVPTTTNTYTMEQLAVAATQLTDAGQRNNVISLLASFGVQALTQLPQEQYGAFATSLRAMGARI